MTIQCTGNEAVAHALNIVDSLAGLDFSLSTVRAVYIADGRGERGAFEIVAANPI